jgi:hypothetical protein
LLLRFIIGILIIILTLRVFYLRLELLLVIDLLRSLPTLFEAYRIYSGRKLDFFYHDFIGHAPDLNNTLLARSY